MVFLHIRPDSEAFGFPIQWTKEAGEQSESGKRTRSGRHECKAYNQVCSSCKKIGHFQAVCRGHYLSSTVPPHAPPGSRVPGEYATLEANLY